jgi:hypothetical protein
MRNALEIKFGLDLGKGNVKGGLLRFCYDHVGLVRKDACLPVDLVLLVNWLFE